MPSIKERVKKALPSWLLLIRKYRKAHGVFPNLVHPATFNEKTLYRILFDRRLVLRRVADKAAVRSYVESRLGPQVLPKLYCLTTRPETIPFDQLPDRFVVKPTHGSGWVQIVTDKSALDRGALIDTCNRWLNQSYYEITREWVYKGIAPQIMVQELIDDGSEAVPNDYRLFVFDGTVELIEVNVGRLSRGRVRLFTPTWEKLAPKLGGDVPRPAHLAEMIAAARTLCGNLDFVRVDFYDTAERLYFGELTTSPECAMGRFLLEGLDGHLGGCWQLPCFATLRTALRSSGACDRQVTPKARLLAGEDPNMPGHLDAQPLVREYSQASILSRRTWRKSPGSLPKIS
jgi:TupA-like ATPgrasp